MSLNLDERQRAMLREMNVEVWWPKPALPVAPPAAQIARPKPPIAPPVRVERAPAVPPVRQIQSSSSSPAIASASASASTLSWPALQLAVTNCQACALCEGRQHSVFGVGQAAPDAQSPPLVDWLIVGEAPGENEDRTGEPFVGQAGQLLSKS